MADATQPTAANIRPQQERARAKISIFLPFVSWRPREASNPARLAQFRVSLGGLEQRVRDVEG